MSLLSFNIMEVVIQAQDSNTVVLWKMDGTF